MSFLCVETWSFENGCRIKNTQTRKKHVDLSLRVLGAFLEENRITSLFFFTE